MSIVQTDVQLHVDVNTRINDFMKSTASFLEIEIKNKSEELELFKKIINIDPNNQIVTSQMQQLQADMQIDIKSLLQLRKDSEFMMPDTKKIIKAEGLCPDCGETKEDVTLVGPTDRAQINKKKKRKLIFSFKETISDWQDVVTEQRFKAFTSSSSFVGNVRYDQDNQSMVMILNGESYNFCNVPERKFDVLEGATSVGKAFNDEIKGQHDC